MSKEILKRIKFVILRNFRGKNFNIRKVEGGIKFDKKWVTLKPSLVFNFLGGFSVPLNSKFKQ